MMGIDDLRRHNAMRSRKIAAVTQAAGGRVDERVERVIRGYDFDYAVDVTKEVVVISVTHVGNSNRACGPGEGEAND